MLGKKNLQPPPPPAAPAYAHSTWGIQRVVLPCGMQMCRCAARKVCLFCFVYLWSTGDGLECHFRDVLSGFRQQQLQWQICKMNDSPKLLLRHLILLLAFLLLQPAFLLLSLFPKTDKNPTQQHRNKAQRQQTTLVSKVFEMLSKRIELLLRNPNLRGPFCDVLELQTLNLREPLLSFKP